MTHVSNRRGVPASSITAVAVLLLVKLAAKMVGVWPLTRYFGFSFREGNYTTLLMSTGLTFGTISALFGLAQGALWQRSP